MRSYAALKRDSDRLRWETDEERAATHGLVPWFPKCVCFVDGVKVGRFRPEEEQEQERVDDGRKHSHCFGVLVFNNSFGVYTKIIITDLGADHDRQLYTDSPPYTAPGQNFADSEHLIWT